MSDPSRVENQAEWFEAADEIILEYIDEREPTTPAPLEDYTTLDFNQIIERAKKLDRAGLIKSLETDLYSLTEKGRNYLQGTEDLRDEPEPE